MYSFTQRLIFAYHLLHPACGHVAGLRHYATKGKAVSDIIRWNKENKMLFGSVHKAAAKTKTTKKQESSEGTTGKQKAATKKKSTKTQSDTAKTAKTKKTAQKDTVDEKTKQRLQDMYLSSVQASAFEEQADDVERMYVETKNLHTKGEPGLFPNVPEDVLFPDNQGEVIVEDSENLEYFPEESKTNDVHIPKILPVPGMTSNVSAASSLSTKKSSASDLGNSSSSKKLSKNSGSGGNESVVASKQDAPVAPKEMDFILHCPVLPSEESDVLQEVQEFRSLVDKMSLRMLPTVNMVLNKTRSELSLFFLQRWRQKMIKELGEEGFKKHQENTLWVGTNFHACVQQFLSGVPLDEIQVQEGNKGHWESLQSVLPDVTNVLALETPVSHPWLFYRGTFDCVAKYKDVLYVIDWKTSSKPKPLLTNLYDNPLQVAAYLGAVNLSAEFKSKFGVVHHAAIVVAYENGQPANVHRMKPAMCQHYWAQWCQRLHQYWALVAAEKGVVAPSQAKQEQEAL